jgi:hypothetical protein
LKGCWFKAIESYSDPSEVQAQNSAIASLTNEDGVCIHTIELQPDVGQQVNQMVAQLREVCPTPHRPGVRFIRDTALTTLADKHTLQFMNEGLVKKSKEGRHFGTARILTVADALRKEEREAKEQQAMNEKERRAALRG